MYTIIPSKKKVKEVMEHDYMFKDFKTFYQVSDLITVPLFGKYSVGVKADSTEELLEFLSKEFLYSALDICLYVPEAIADYILMRQPNLNTKDTVSPFEVFIELCREKNILFGKNVMRTLYSSIEHDFSDMDEALNLIVMEYGEFTLITEKMLAPLFILNKTVYPRTVLLAFLWQDRYRWSKLKKCVDQMGNDLVVGAMVKNIKTLLKKKCEYLKTSQGDGVVKTVPAHNITLMYRVLVLERDGLNDITLLLTLFERGLSTHDIIQERRN